MKTRYLILLAILLLVFTACTAQPTPVYVPEGTDRDTITADSDIFIENILNGIANKDHATFSADFDEQMLTAMKADSFDQICAVYSPLGEPTSIELLNVQVVDVYYAVRYTVTYPQKEIVVRVVVDGNDPRKVSGLWFE
jgi:hypothetical protein